MSLIVTVSELYERIKEMRDDGMDFVEVTLDEGDDDDTEYPLPPRINFTAWTKAESFEHIDYEEIEGTLSEL